MAAGLLFLCAAARVAAVPVECGWERDDERISRYRYQLNGEEDDGWTVVDGATTSISVDMGAGINTIYVQASYDGVKWSESGHATYVVAREAPADSMASDGAAGTAAGSGRGSKRYEASIGLSPYALQRITYSDDIGYDNRTSRYGLGARLGIAFNISNRFGIGAGLAYEWHGFEGFHDYSDIKLDARIRYTILGSGRKGPRLLLEVGGGADLAIRDDGDIGLYPLVSYGIRGGMMLSDSISMDMGCALAHTFQDGSSVLHVAPAIGMSCHWGRR